MEADNSTLLNDGYIYEWLIIEFLGKCYVEETEIGLKDLINLPKRSGIILARIHNFIV